MPDFQTVIIVGAFIAVAIALSYVENRRRDARELNARLESALKEIRHWMDEAAKGYRFRAELGDVDSMVSLARYFENGADSRMNAARVARDPHTDFAAALYWFEKAASKGNASAMFSVAYMHHKGITPSLQENRIEAEVWYQKAIQAGYKEAPEWLERLRKGM